MNFIRRFLYSNFPQMVAVIMALSFIAFWFWLTLDIGQVTVLRCHAIEPTMVDCVLQKSALGWSLGTETIKSIRTVDWVEDCTDDCSYWFELQTRSGAEVSIPVTENDRAQLAKFKSFVRGEDAPLEMELTVGNNWGQLLIVWGAGVFIASGFILPLIFDRLSAKD